MTLAEIAIPSNEQRRIEKLNKIAKIAKQRAKEEKARANLQKAQQQLRDIHRRRNNLSLIG